MRFPGAVKKTILATESQRPRGVAPQPFEIREVSPRLLVVSVLYSVPCLPVVLDRLVEATASCVCVTSILDGRGVLARRDLDKDDRFTRFDLCDAGQERAVRVCRIVVHRPAADVRAGIAGIRDLEPVGTKRTGAARPGRYFGNSERRASASSGAVTVRV